MAHQCRAGGGTATPCCPIQLRRRRPCAPPPLPPRLQALLFLYICALSCCSHTGATDDHGEQPADATAVVDGRAADAALRARADALYREAVAVRWAGLVGGCGRGESEVQTKILFDLFFVCKAKPACGRPRATTRPRSRATTRLPFRHTSFAKPPCCPRAATRAPSYHHRTALLPPPARAPSRHLPAALAPPPDRCGEGGGHVSVRPPSRHHPPLSRSAARRDPQATPRARRAAVDQLTTAARVSLDAPGGTRDALAGEWPGLAVGRPTHAAALRELAAAVDAGALLSGWGRGGEGGFGRGRAATRLSPTHTPSTPHSCRR